jgi:uncharacterized protein YjiS (DUF1127 family)
MSRLVARMRTLPARLASWLARIRERRQLAQMSDRDLRDVGLSRYDALWECRKPFWKP